MSARSALCQFMHINEDPQVQADIGVTHRRSVVDFRLAIWLRKHISIATKGLRIADRKKRIPAKERESARAAYFRNL